MKSACLCRCCATPGCSTEPEMTVDKDPGLDRAKIAAARLFATSRYPYLASAIFASPIVATRGSATIAVDRQWRVTADPAALDQLETQDLGRLLAHLTSHLLRDHDTRASNAGVAEGGDPARWNRAADAEINDDLAPDNMIPSCAADLADTFGMDTALLAEQYYQAIPSGSRTWDCGSGCDSIPRPWDTDLRGNTGIDPRQAEWLRLGVAAEMQRLEQLQPGTVPAGWLRWAEEVFPSKVDWRRLIAAEVRTAVARVAGMVDYSYRRPSRRADTVPTIIIPSLQRPLPEIAVVCDTSGSMGDEELSRVLVEVEALLRRAGLPDSQLRVLACDAEVQSVRRVSRASQVQLLGGGGTDMAEGITHVARLQPRPDIIVVLTDGLTPWPDKSPPGLTVIAGIIGNDTHRYHHAALGVPTPPRWIRTVSITN
jgi:predicted metal-dependent peptidase